MTFFTERVASVNLRKTFAERQGYCLKTKCILNETFQIHILFSNLLLVKLKKYCLFKYLLSRLTLFWPMFPFYTSWRHQNILGFLVFSDGVRWEIPQKLVKRHYSNHDVNHYLKIVLIRCVMVAGYFYNL